MENMMSLEEAVRRIEELEKRKCRDFAYNWNITKVEKRVEEKT